MAKTHLNKRVVEIDLLRTVAILMMVIYHIAFDLKTFYDVDIPLFHGGWEVFRVATASLFLLVAGMASHFSSRPLHRALTVLGAATLVTVATYLYDPDTFIYFGILHCIGFGLLLLIPLRRFQEWNIVFGILILIMHVPLSTLRFTLPPTLDYYPLLPWVGYLLIGSGIGHYLYIRNNVRLCSTVHFPLSIFTLPGRHALAIYLLHQPIILGVLWLIW